MSVVPAGCARFMRSNLALTVVVGAVTIAGLSGPAAFAAISGGGSWHFDEPADESTAEDSSGYRNDGRLRGGVAAGQEGIRGNAYSFATDGSWVEVPSSESLNPGTSDFSYSAYVKLSLAPMKTGETYDIIRKGLVNTTGGEYKLEVVRYGRVACTAKDSDKVVARVVGPKTSVADNEWHFIGCERRGSAWRVTVDSAVKSKLVTFGSVSNSRSLSLGSKYGKEDATPGLVDEPKVTVGTP